MSELFRWYQAILCLKCHSLLTSRSLECTYFLINSVFVVYACACVGETGMVSDGFSTPSDLGEKISSEGK